MEAIFVLALFLFAKRFAVEEKFGFVAGRVDMDGSSLADAIGPIPMRKNVCHWKVRTPAGLVKVETIFFESGEVYDAKIRAARWDVNLTDFFELFCHASFFVGISEIEQVTGVRVVGSRFAKIIEAGPDEFTGDIGKLVLAVEFPIGRCGPRRGIKIVGAHLEVGFAAVFVGADGKEIFAARSDARSGFAAEEGKVFVRSAHFAVVEWFVVVAENVDLLLEAVEAGIVIVATGSDGASEIFGADDAGEFSGDFVAGG